MESSLGSWAVAAVADYADSDSSVADSDFFVADSDQIHLNCFHRINAGEGNLNIEKKESN